MFCTSDHVSVTPPDTKTWPKQGNSRCSEKYSTRYDSLEAAQAACVKLDYYCAGVMDYGCTGQDSLFLCKIGKTGHLMKFDYVGCVYQNPGWFKRSFPHV